MSASLSNDEKMAIERMKVATTISTKEKRLDELIRLLLRSRHIIQANPGFAIVQAFRHSNGKDIFFGQPTDVVAWDFTDSDLSEPEPICLRSDVDTDNYIETAVVQPNGTVIVGHVSTYASLDVWKNELSIEFHANKKRSKTK